MRWKLNPHQPAAAIQSVLNDPDDFLKDPALLLKNTAQVTIGRVPARKPGQPDLVLRRLNYGNFRHRIRDVFRRSRAERALRVGVGLEQSGVATPRVLAATEVRRWRWPVVAYLITEEVSPAITLSDYLIKNRAVPRIVIQRLAQVIAHLHNSGFSQRDFKATNVLLDAQLRPWLIDLDGVRRFRIVNEKRAAADLGRLAHEFVLYAHDLRWNGWRFIHWYCRERGWQKQMRQLADRVSAQMLRYRIVRTRRNRQ